MSNSITPAVLFDSHHEKLDLTWVAGQSGADRPVKTAEGENPCAPSFVAWIGHLNLVHPTRIPVLGPTEVNFLSGLGQDSLDETLEKIFATRPACMIVSDGRKVINECVLMAEATATPLFFSSLPAYQIITHLQYYLSDALADRITVHGVLMEVLGIGVLLTGKSGIGKSELALELISRNHRLVADDAPEFRRIAPDLLNGFCPPQLNGFLEVRGLGVLNVRAMFGDSAIKLNKNLRLIIELQRMNDEELIRIDRLQGSRQTRTILDVEVPQITLPVVPGHNLAVLAESAVRNHILLLKGYNAAEAFIEHQQRVVLDGDA